MSPNFQTVDICLTALEDSCKIMRNNIKQNIHIYIHIYIYIERERGREKYIYIFVQRSDSSLDLSEVELFCKVN